MQYQLPCRHAKKTVLDLAASKLAVSVSVSIERRDNAAVSFSVGVSVGKVHPFADMKQGQRISETQILGDFVGEPLNICQYQQEDCRHVSWEIQGHMVAPGRKDKEQT